jgi:hypothetical protein
MACAAPARAAFHLMQIEAIIGGVNGDTGAQAIQLRMRSVGQPFVSFTRLVAHDAAGNNPVVLINFPTDVASGNEGDRVLVVSPGFGAHSTPAMQADFVMTNPIPASYLAAGRITFEDIFGTILWSVSYGGAAYTGSNIGSMTNDEDGDFGPPFPGPLPTSSLQALVFNGPATAPSTSNDADYSLTPGAAVLTNNAGETFTIAGGSCPPCPVDWDGNCQVQPADIALFVNTWVASLAAGTLAGDFDGSGSVQPADVALFVSAWFAALTSPCP